MKTIQIKQEVLPIRTITTSSMIRRFTVDEETAILDGTDTRAKVIRERMITASYADLDFEELVYGVAYIVNFLNSADALYNADAATRTDMLLADGTRFEKYLGDL
ncbi:MAG: hypothetical protein HRU12_10095 [Phaeodactylibacter sp.]|nr:hypothetical protein [Phaeodactylibacter sp.]